MCCVSVTWQPVKCGNIPFFNYIFALNLKVFEFYEETILKVHFERHVHAYETDIWERDFTRMLT